ncbi:MAG: ferric iron uptake transcriptional regulator [Gammaproteobacteria bacterium]|nr:ferric iron uptake transcriptional regulator [Gammaproteobacteria bacterium]
MEKNDLKAVGLKITTPRMRILEVLSSSGDRHFSAEDIYQHLRDIDKDISVATIYRVLTQFEAAGLVIRHNFSEAYSVFELNQGCHHDHLVCLQCRRVIEFHDPVIEERQDALTQRVGFKATDHSLTIYGICQDCQ